MEDNKSASELVLTERTKQKSGKYILNFDKRVNHQGNLMIASKGILEEPLEYREMSRPCNWNMYKWNGYCRRSLKERLILSASFLCAEYDRLESIEKDQNEDV